MNLVHTQHLTIALNFSACGNNTNIFFAYIMTMQYLAWIILLSDNTANAIQKINQAKTKITPFSNAFFSYKKFFDDNISTSATYFKDDEYSKFWGTIAQWLKEENRTDEAFHILNGIVEKQKKDLGVSASSHSGPFLFTRNLLFLPCINGPLAQQRPVPTIPIDMCF